MRNCVFGEYFKGWAYWTKLGEGSLEVFADHLGLQYPQDRDQILAAIRLSRLPANVREEFRKRCVGGETPIRLWHIARLYSAYNSEYAEYPEGYGPMFTKRWEEITE